MSSPSTPSSPVRARKIHKFGAQFVAHGLAFLGIPEVFRWAGAVNGWMEFGRISSRVAEVSSNSKGWALTTRPSSVGVALRVDFLTDRWRMATFPGSRCSRRIDGAMAPSVRGMGIRPVCLSLAPTRRIPSGGRTRMGICCLRRIPHYRADLRSNGGPT